MRNWPQHYGKCVAVLIGLALIAALSASCSPASPGSSSMEAVHASYLDLTSNISDLRSRVAEWQKGDPDSLNVAGEKLERIETVIGAVAWPKDMGAAIAKAKAAAGPMATALQDKDAAAASVAADTFGDASHDVTHAFYGDWLPAMEGMQFTQMGSHAGYLDLSANLSDLQTRLGQWQKGDESSLNVAKEKTERAEVLIRHMFSSGVMTKRLQEIERDLIPMFAALESADMGAAQAAMIPLAEASRNLSRDAYAWMDLVTGTNDPACIQASYLDLSRNMTDLRDGVAKWQKGDENGLATAQQKLARVEVVVAHPIWPSDMAVSVDRARSAIGPMARALQEKDPAAAAAVAKEFGDASHDVTHAFYGDWLPAGELRSAGAPAGNSQTASQASSAAHTGGHGHSTDASTGPPVSSTGPDWLIIGGFLGMMALVIGVAAVTKPTPAMG